MPVAKPKLDEPTQSPPCRDAGRVADALNPNRAVTLAEAAGMLGITEAFVAYLVDGEVIPPHMVGLHRRVMLRDILVYKEQRDRGNKILGEIIARDQEMGLY